MPRTPRTRSPKSDRRLPRFTVTGSVSAPRHSSVLKALSKAFPDTHWTVTHVTLNPSRADRLSDARKLVEEARSEVESLKEEMEQWHDNMPENLQNADKGTEVQEAADALSSIADQLDSAVTEMEQMSFPGMY